MYVIVDFAGQQFKAEKDARYYVHRLEADVEATVEFNKVMLLDNAGKVEVGTPYIDGCTVKARVLNHLKGDKVTVFKKKRRKGYQKSNGHRQYLTQIVVEDIITK